MEFFGTHLNRPLRDEPDQEIDLPDKSRPFGVTVISASFVLNMIVSAVRVYLAGLDTQSLMESFLITDVAGPVLAFAGLLIGVGLFFLHRWAWIGAMVWAGINMVQALYAYYHENPQFETMALSVVIVFYLNQRAVQAAFIDPEEAERGELISD